MHTPLNHLEEERLGKPYNLRLLRRLSAYASPYKGSIALALCLTLLITAIDLAVPYLSKIAIDRYIMGFWHRIEVRQLTPSLSQEIRDKYGDLLERSLDGSYYFISNTDRKEMDPADLNRYEEQHVFSPGKFYRVDPAALEGTGLGGAKEEFPRLSDGSVLIPKHRADKLPGSEVIKIRGEDIQGLTVMGVALVILILLSFGLGYGEHYMLEFTGQHMMQDIRLRLFKNMQSQGMSFFDRHPVGRLTTRVTNDIENLNEMFKSVLVTVFKDIFLLLGILSVMTYLNWRLAMVCFILIPFIFVLTLFFSRIAREAFRELRAAVAKINTFLQERLKAMRVVQLFTRERIQMKAFEEINHENYLAGMKQIHVFAVFMPLMELASSFAVALILWHGGGKVIEEELSLGSLVAFISYIQMFFKPIRDLSEKYNIMQSAMASTERIFEFMDHQERVPNPVTPVSPKEVKGGIAFQDVTFGYEKDRPVIRNISFEVRPGEVVAIVGHTGSGKTTLINLMERFYDPDKGKIDLDGIDLRKWDKSELRRNITLVMQDVFLFGGDIGENIALGRPELGPGAVEEAARASNAIGFIQKRQGGFRQGIGEDGAILSAGERQLLSFARALATYAPVLILDEATSSVDPHTEELIQEAISRMSKQRTTLLIAHRPTTIRHADRILVMHRGELMEQGTHEALLAKKGIYYRLNQVKEAHN